MEIFEKIAAGSRVEADSIGTLEVPENAYYGVQSLRAKRNFPITGTKLHPLFIRNLARIKLAAAETNRRSGKLGAEKADAIAKACREIMRGKLTESFIVDGIQGGAGTSANMNANEVIANRSIEILGGRKGDYRIVHPNDDVNMCQSTNDVIPTCGKLTSLDLLQDLDRELKALTPEEIETLIMTELKYDVSDFILDYRSVVYGDNASGERDYRIVYDNFRTAIKAARKEKKRINKSHL